MATSATSSVAEEETHKGLENYVACPFLLDLPAKWECEIPKEKSLLFDTGNNIPISPALKTISSTERDTYGNSWQSVPGRHFLISRLTEDDENTEEKE